MPAIDHLRTALAEVQLYKSESVCGYCRDVAETIGDSLQTTIETDDAVREIVRRHPAAGRLPEVRDSLRETRDLARERLSSPVPTGAGGPPVPGGAAGLDVLGLRSSLRSIVTGVVPRPRDLIPR